MRNKGPGRREEIEKHGGWGQGNKKEKIRIKMLGEERGRRRGCGEEGGKGKEDRGMKGRKSCKGRKVRAKRVLKEGRGERRTKKAGEKEEKRDKGKRRYDAGMRKGRIYKGKGIG